MGQVFCEFLEMATGRDEYGRTWINLLHPWPSLEVACLKFHSSHGGGIVNLPADANVVGAVVRLKYDKL